jgi:NDP-sugar pyrophosphorylase family protein
VTNRFDFTIEVAIEPFPAGRRGTRDDTPTSGFFFRRPLVDRLGERCSLERDVLAPLAAAGALRDVVFDGYFIDIGIPEDLARAQREIPKRHVRG